MDKIQFQCSGCGKGVSVPADKAGTTGNCPSCGLALQIPQPRSYYKQCLLTAGEALKKAYELRDNGEGDKVGSCIQLAEDRLREVLESTCLPWLYAGYEVMALSMLGSRYEYDGKDAEAIDALERAVALRRRVKGLTDNGSADADALGNLYDNAIVRLVTAGQINEAQVVMSKLNELIKCYRNADGFQWARHEKILPLAKGLVPIPSSATAGLLVAPTASPKANGTEESVPSITGVLDAFKNDDYPRASELAQGVLRTSNACSLEYALALGIIGTVYKLTDRLAEARPFFENSLALFTLQDSQHDLVPVFADTLGYIYDATIHEAIANQDFQQAKSLCPKLADLIARFRSLESFNWIRHEGMLFFAEGMIAAKCEGNRGKYITLMHRVAGSPYKEHFAGSDLPFMLGLAYENIGRYYFLDVYRPKDSIPYFEEAIRYYDQDDSKLRAVQELLAEAKSQAASASELPAVPSDLKEKLDFLRSGDDETRLTVFEQLPTDLPHEYFRAVQSAVMQAMGAGDSRVRLRGAMLLVSIGDESYPPIDVLLGNLTPPPSDVASKVKRFALHGLSYVKGRQDVVGKLIEVANHDPDATVRERAVFALAATGNASARQFVCELANAGNDAAVYAVGVDVESLRDAIFNGREILPHAAMKLLYEGLNSFEKRDQDTEILIETLKSAIKSQSSTGSDEVAVRLAFSLACGRRQAELRGGETKVRLLSESVTQLERAAKLDSKGGYGILAQHLGTLSGYDVHCSFEADSIAEKDGLDAAIAFLEEKLRLFGHVPGDPLIHILENLAERYYNRYEDRRLYREAKLCLQRVLNAQPIPDRESDCEDVKKAARSNLAVIEQFAIDRPPADTTKSAPPHAKRQRRGERSADPQYRGCPLSNWHGVSCFAAEHSIG